MRQAGHLCSRCGNDRWIRLSETESRCAECGLGSTSSRLTAVGPSTPRSAEEQAHIDRLLREMAQREHEVFVDLPFSIYGLDDRFAGIRSLGGHGSSNGERTDVTLAFGDIDDQDAPRLRVETRRPHTIDRRGRLDLDIERVMAVQSLLHELAHEVGALPDDVRAAAFPYQDPEAFGKDPAAPWDDVIVSVDGTPNAGKALTVGDSWVACLTYHGLVIGVVARRWPLAEVALVEVTDFATYIAGSAEIRTRMTRRHDEPG